MVGFLSFGDFGYLDFLVDGVSCRWTFTVGRISHVCITTGDGRVCVCVCVCVCVYEYEYVYLYVYVYEYVYLYVYVYVYVCMYVCVC